jgi:putative addiction module killer protein
MIAVREFLDANLRSPFGKWFASLDGVAAARVRAYLTRVREGNFSNVKSVGAGVSEITMDFGSGYRVYIGQDGEELIILLGGGKKSRQQNDITAAKAAWLEYKSTKKREK